MRISCLVIVASVAAATASLAAAAVLAPHGGAPSAAPRPAVVTLQPGWFAYRPLGDFESAGKTVDAPARATRLDAPLDVMKRAGQPGRIRALRRRRRLPEAEDPRSGGGEPAGRRRELLDATAYAEWYARQTGEDWRLPTDDEWAYAAAERFHGEPPPAARDADFAARWLAKFRRRCGARDATKLPQPFGHFGLTAAASPTFPATSGSGTNSCYERRAVAAAASRTC